MTWRELIECALQPAQFVFGNERTILQRFVPSTPIKSGSATAAMGTTFPFGRGR